MSHGNCTNVEADALEDLNRSRLNLRISPDDSCILDGHFQYEIEQCERQLFYANFEIWWNISFDFRLSKAIVYQKLNLSASTSVFTRCPKQLLAEHRCIYLANCCTCMVQLLIKQNDCTELMTATYLKIKKHTEKTNGVLGLSRNECTHEKTVVES
uniref:Uncharacterized protein n=1 Tax=Romanomermis culicivorax TaxID=13658 RepID=A0A915ICI0_ROMCU